MSLKKRTLSQTFSTEVFPDRRNFPRAGRTAILCLLLLGVLGGGRTVWAAASELPFLAKAHAHNNNEQARPFYGAIELGYTGIEADVHLVEGKLLVGHDKNTLQANRTLSAVFLEPLRRRVKENGGQVFPGAPVQILLIDVKTEAAATYRALHELLTGYADMLVTFEGDKKKPGPVMVIISGNRDKESMKADRRRYAAMDGRMPDLSEPQADPLMPMISDTWEKYFTWRGVGVLPPAEKDKLAQIVSQAHARGQWVRFWATPDKPSPEREAVWKELLAAGVDFLNSDDLPALQQFLSAHPELGKGKSLR